MLCANSNKQHVQDRKKQRDVLKQPPVTPLIQIHPRCPGWSFQLRRSCLSSVLLSLSRLSQSGAALWFITGATCSHTCGRLRLVNQDLTRVLFESRRTRRRGGPTAPPRRPAATQEVKDASTEGFTLSRCVFTGPPVTRDGKEIGRSR